MHIKFLLLALLLPFNAYADGRITNADIYSAAAIAFTKMAASTANNVCTFNSSGFIAGGVAPGTSGNVLMSNGTSWISAAPVDTGVTTMGAFGSSPNADGASISGVTLTLQPASASFPGGVSTGAQTFAGSKTLSIAAISNLTSNGLVTTSGGAGTLSVTDPSTDFLSQYFLLAGRSGGQVAYGGTAASDTLTLSSTANATKGNVVISPGTSEKLIAGTTGSATTFNGNQEFLAPNSSGANNGLVVRLNNIAAFNAGSGTGNANGWSITPRGPSASPEIRCSTNGGDVPCFFRTYDSGFGNLYGYYSMGSSHTFMNSNAALVTMKVSGTTGQSANIVNFSKTSDAGSVDGSIGEGAQFRAPAGTVTVAGFAFQGDNNNGWWAPAADTQAWSTGGVERMRLSSSGLTMGLAGTTTGLLNFSGSTSGTITVQSQATAGTYNFNLPTSAGTSGQPLLSGGGGSTAQTYGTLGVGGGGTGATTFTADLPLIGNGTSAVTQGTRTGNTTTFVTATGSLPSGNCPEFDASGNIVDSGAPCGGGSAGGFTFIGWAKFVQTTNCEPSRSSQNSYGDLSDADCTQPSGGSLLGGLTAPGSDLIGFTMTADSTKYYLVKVSGYLTNGSSGLSCGWRLTDGTDTSIDIDYTPSSQDAGNTTVMQLIKFSSSASKVVKLQTTGINASGGCSVQMGQTGKQLTFSVFEIDAP